MASSPLPPGFASRRSPPSLPPRVTSVVATSKLHRCRQESRPGKVTSSEPLLYLVLLPCLRVRMCLCVVCISIFGECSVLVSLEYYLYSGISYEMMFLVRVWMLGNSDLGLFVEQND
ncbi:hypothetical protein VPH35_129411 [Triticum aestivum]